ncbi:hypothetical protein C0991_007281, partial [Blastosporella zonata]
MFALLTLNEDEGVAAPSLLVLDFKKEPKERRAIRETEYSTSFLFPQLHGDMDVLSNELRSDPAPSFSPASQHELPFYLAPNNRLFITSLGLTSLTRRQYSINVFAPLSTFSSCLNRCVPGQKVMDWCVWGPRGTRVLIPDQPASDVWVCYVNGSRFVSLQEMDGKGIGVGVYDFYQPGLYRALGDPEDVMDCVTEATVFEAGHIFKEEVRTTLPYRLKMLSLDAKHTSDMAVMCTEDHLIIVD